MQASDAAGDADLDAVGVRPGAGDEAAAAEQMPASSSSSPRASKEGSGARTSGRTSISIFRKHLVCYKDDKGVDRIDASGVVSEECYRMWLDNYQNGRRKFREKPEKIFQRILTAYVTGSDGRKPFTLEEERAVLQVMREKRVWPAFANMPGVFIGRHVSRSSGHA